MSCDRGGGFLGGHAGFQSEDVERRGVSLVWNVDHATCGRAGGCASEERGPCRALSCDLLPALGRNGHIKAQTQH